MNLPRKDKKQAAHFISNPWTNEIYPSPKRPSWLSEAVIILALLGLMAVVVFLALGWAASW